jgi:hypothetical protein
MNLYQASNQWATRPADERYWSLAEMYDACLGHHQTAREAKVGLSDLYVTPDHDNNLLLCGKEARAVLTHHCFGQVAAKAGAPAEYLRSLPRDLACRNVNHGLMRAAGSDENGVNLLLHQNGKLVVRSMTSEHYSRIWNYQIVQLLQRLGEDWRVPPARPAMADQPGVRRATAADILPNQGDFGLQVRVGDLIAPAGLYASDHDCFVFLVNENRRIDDGSGPGLARGFFVLNSEVGGAAFKVIRFAYRHVCGNHIVWGASGVEELRIVHRGNADRRFGYEMMCELRKYADESASLEEGRILAAKQLVLGNTQENLIDRLFKAQIAPKRTLEAAYDVAKQESDVYRDIDPRSAWGMAQGMTALARNELYTDKRAALERASGKILQMAF